MPPVPQSLSKLPLPPPVFLILLSLADGEEHGYSIRQEVIERSGGAVTLDPGSLYRLLSRLFDEGLVDESASPPAHHNDDERRRYYRLTARGRKVLDAETDRLEHLVAQARAARAARRHA